MINNEKIVFNIKGENFIMANKWQNIVKKFNKDNRSEKSNEIIKEYSDKLQEKIDFIDNILDLVKKELKAFANKDKQVYIVNWIKSGWSLIAEIHKEDKIKVGKEFKIEKELIGYLIIPIDELEELNDLYVKNDKHLILSELSTKLNQKIERNEITDKFTVESKSNSITYSPNIKLDLDDWWDSLTF